VPVEPLVRFFVVLVTVLVFATSPALSARFFSLALIIIDILIESSTHTHPPPTQYIIMNLGLSENFGFIDFAHLTFPVVMRIEWVRVYQDPENVNVGCDPKDYPTVGYINQCVFLFCFLFHSCFPFAVSGSALFSLGSNSRSSFLS
jgi:hypothetical protein